MADLTLDSRPEALTPTAVRVLRIAADHPGKRLRRVGIDRQYGTLREACATLRRAGLLYPAKPSVLLARPDWSKRAALVDIDPEADHDYHAVHRAVLYLALKRPGIEQAAAVEEVTAATRATPYQVTSAIKSLRMASRLLHPWDGLVLTDKGVQASREAGREPVAQVGTQQDATP